MGKVDEKGVEVAKDIAYEAILRLGTTESFLLDVLFELEHIDPTRLLVEKLYDEVVRTKVQLRNYLLEYLEGFTNEKC